GEARRVCRSLARGRDGGGPAAPGAGAELGRAVGQTGRAVAVGEPRGVCPWDCWGLSRYWAPLLRQPLLAGCRQAHARGGQSRQGEAAANRPGVADDRTGGLSRTADP